MADRPQGVQLYRRAGRRRSTPTSPISPVFQKPYGRPADPYNPRDAFSATVSSKSPSIDLHVPSPTFDLSSLSPALMDAESVTNKPHHATRASDDYGIQRPKFSGEMARPSTSGPSPSPSQATFHRSTHSSDTSSQSAHRPDPSQNFDEILRRTGARETQDEGPGPTLRTASASSFYTDRSTGDEPGGPKTQNPKKSRLNLLNPMSLLARRRSSQTVAKAEDNNFSIHSFHAPAIPKDFDPSIRGSIVHDFSAPRTRRINSDHSPIPGALPSPGYPRRPSELTSPPSQPVSSTSVPSTHSPMFKEHFQEDRKVVPPINTAFLQTTNMQAPPAVALPSFARKLPVQIPDQDNDLGHTISSDIGDNFDNNEEVRPPEPTQAPPPLPQPERTPSPVLDLPPISELPKHMTSTSSRFSFQIGAQASLNLERLLEEKHKEHASKRLAKIKDADETAEDEFADYDFDDDAFEEKIPGVNTDFDEDDGFDNSDIPVRNIDVPSSQIESRKPMMFMPIFEEDDDEFDTGDIEIRNIDVPTSAMKQQTTMKGIGEDQDLRDFHFTPQSMTFSPSTAQHTSEPTPRDATGNVIGFAQSQDGLEGYKQQQTSDSLQAMPQAMFLEGLGIQSTEPVDSSPEKVHNSSSLFDDSDLYFDDGEFDNDFVETGESFNEELLDDENGVIKDIPAANAQRHQEALQRSSSNTNVDPGQHQKPSTDTHSHPSASFPERHVVGSENRSSVQAQPGLTEDNLAAYHDALALAANKAAASGKFDRNVSFDQSSDDGFDSPFHNSVPGVSSNGSRYSNNFISSAISDEGGFQFDDDFDDEDMIAAANAEALENDDDGFYGQEFGFYARAHGRHSAEFTNGGYFTSRGSNGVKRSHSGKNNFQEPSLTPITERSEWSTRNSVASLPLHTGIPGSAQSIPSPGIAQLLERDSPIVEDEMTLSALMKLRRGAFGGSSTSINSIGERHNSGSSPLAHVSGYSFPSTDSMVGRMSSPTPGRRSSMSIAESEDEDDLDERPTVTQNTPYKKSIEPATRTSYDGLPSSPINRTGNHSRNSSGAESVSYAREKDGRWVLERRRTGDDGELELIGREYLAAARI